MPNRRLDYVVNVDSGGAVSSLNQVGRAGADAARDIEQGFDKAGTASEQAIKALTATMDTLESDSAAAAKAVAAIGEHLTIDVDSSTLNRFVTDLKSKFGVAFDAVEADAKQFADVLSRGVDMSRTTNEIKGVGDQLDHTSDSADQSRSVLANLAGNSAQSLGELGGVVGDLGVGIGQLAEYAVDGNIKMSQLASVAGPMAALAAASLIVTQGMKGMAEVKAFDAERAQDFADALRDGGTAATALHDTIVETGQLNVAHGGIFGNFMGGVDDILPRLEELGINYAQFVKLATDPAEFNALVALRDSTSDPQLRSDLLHIIEGVTDYADAATDATRKQQELNEFLMVTPEMLDAATTGFQRQQQIMDTSTTVWQVLIDWMASGEAATQDATAAMEFLTEATGQTEDQILAIAQTKLDEQMAKAAEHTKATADAFHELHAAAEETARGLADAVAVMNSADFDAAGIDAAATAMADWFAASKLGAEGGPAIFNDYIEAVQGLGTVMQDTGPIAAKVLSGFAITDDQRAQLAALNQLGQTVMPRITEAYDQANGNFEQFDRNVQQISQSIHNDLVTQLVAAGVSANDAEDQANSLQVALGLVPGNVSTFFELQGDADATAKLALLQGSMDLLSEGAQAEVAMHILADDPQAALAVMQADLNASHVNVTANLNTGPAMTDYWALAGAIEGHTIHAPVRLTIMNRGAVTQAVGVGPSPTMVGPSPMSAGPAATTAAPAQSWAPATLAVPAPRPINVTLNAAVIGSSYDVQRAVTTAMRQAERLGRI